MLEHGLIVSINTDDPGVSAIDLSYEFEVVAPPAYPATKFAGPRSTRSKRHLSRRRRSDR
jgi:hypothetical protein